METYETDVVVIVVDASAMPTPVSANTNLTDMLLSYKLAGTALGASSR